MTDLRSSPEDERLARIMDEEVAWLESGHETITAKARAERIADRRAIASRLRSPRNEDAKTLSVKYIAQREPKDCAIACMAMVAGLGYYDVLPALPQSWWDTRDGMFTSQIPYILGRLGVATRVVYDDALERPAGLRLLCSRGHFVVVLPDDTVLDPARGPTCKLTDEAYSNPFAVYECHRVIPDFEREDHVKGCAEMGCEECHENFLDAQAESMCHE